MRKLLLLLVVIPFVCFSQSTLVKWYQSDLKPTLVESHISSSTLTGAQNLQWGSDDVFYTTNGNFTPASSPDPTKYMQFTVKPDIGYQINLKSFVFNARSQKSSPKFQIKYSKNDNFSDAQVLLGETSTTTNYVAYDLNFPAGMQVKSGENLYIRIYVYQANDNFHIEHNLSGSIAPSISGTVSLFNPLKPVAVGDKTSTLKNTSLNIDVLANDDYASSGALTKITALKPTHGTVVVNGVKDIKYTPDTGYVGYDSFSYTITNSIGESNSAKVEIQVLDGNEIVLERWNKTDFSPVHYLSGVTGSKIETAGGVIINNFSPQWISNTAYNSFVFSGLSTSTNLNGTLDPTKFIQFSIKSTLADVGIVLKKLNLQYNAQGTGNFSIKYSKDPNFNSNVFTLVNNKSYTESAYSQWFNLDESFAAGTVVYPNETVYVRIYVYNASYNSATFYIRTGVRDNASILNGPTISGIKADLHPEPCTTTVTWNGTSWSGTPTIDKKAIINGNYNTETNGNFSACTLVINSGKLTITDKKSVSVYNDIKVENGAFLEVQNNGNLVQVNDEAPANTGNSVVQTEIAIGSGRTQYNYIGSPVAFSAGETMKTIYPGMTSVLSYNEHNNLFSNSNGIVPAGKGLALKEPSVAGVPAINNKVTAVFKGVPQNGVVTYVLANSNTPTSTSLGYNLLANPYPSNINIKKLYELNGGSENLSSTIYLWDNGVNNDIAQTQQGSSYSGQAYAIFNAAAGKAGTGTSAAGYLNQNVIGKKTPINILSVGQGFLVKAAVKDYVFKFDNSVRTNQDADTKFLGKIAEDEEEENRFWLKLISPVNLTNSLAVIYFDGGNNALGAEDSQARSASDAIFSIVENKKIAVNGRAPFVKSDKIPLGTQHFATGNYTISIEKAEGIFANGQSIYLKDKELGILANLSAGDYTFSVNSGANTGRFEIVYESEITLATDTAVKEEVIIYKESGDFVVKASSKKITELELFDMSGRLVYKSKPNAVKVTVDSAKLNAGVYIFRINQGGKVIAKKVIK